MSKMKPMLSRDSYWIFGLCAFLNVGCRKFVEIPPPTTELVSTSVFADNAAAISTQLAVYAQMNQDVYFLQYYIGLSSDELTSYYNSGLAYDLYSNTLNADNDGGITEWAKIYKYIYQENAIIEGDRNSGTLSSVVKKQQIGEAEFNRAYWYFYLINLFGDVPLVVSTDYTLNTTMTRTDKNTVYQQMVSDLKNASDSLSTNFLDASDTLVTTERVRPTAWAAKALLARVYLYTGDWAGAENVASAVIANAAQFQLVGLGQGVFNKNSMEAIWQLQTPTTLPCTYEGYYFSLLAPPAANSSNVTLNPQLKSAFETGDQRWTYWVGKLPDPAGTDTFYYPYKYKANLKSPKPASEYNMMLRLGEQYLIRAEARARQNKLSDGLADVNQVRSRAGLVPLPNTLSQADLLAAIAKERRIELFTEADRWIDLKRTGTIDSVMTIATPLKKTGIAWSSYQQWYPLPVSDLKEDHNLVQNPGY